MKSAYNIFLRYYDNNLIDNQLYQDYNVKKGLRNEDGTGVLVALTKISDVVGYKIENGEKKDIDGNLYYRGYSLFDLCSSVDEYGYERCCFLILFGKLPNKNELKTFNSIIANQYELPIEFIASYILKTPSSNIMNKIQRALLLLYSADDLADDNSIENTLNQGISIMAKMPSIITYAYHAKNHFFNNDSLYIHHPNHKASIAENFLRLLRPDSNYLKEEVRILNVLLIIHLDHGCGNNSTFTNTVISSTDTDIYSAFSGSVGSLKGKKHGGANSTCISMMNYIIEDVGLGASEKTLKDIVLKILSKDYYDNSGLIYGLGHAVYTKSDPRAQILKDEVKSLVSLKEAEETFSFYQRFEKVACQTINEVKKLNTCVNVDYYSGFIYKLMDIPEDLFTPLFVLSRNCGWLAHNIECKINSNKIIRPAGKYVGKYKEYIKESEK